MHQAGTAGTALSLSCHVPRAHPGGASASQRPPLPPRCGCSHSSASSDQLLCLWLCSKGCWGSGRQRGRACGIRGVPPPPTWQTQDRQLIKSVCSEEKMLTALGWMTLKVLTLWCLWLMAVQGGCCSDPVGFGCEQHTHCRYQILLGCSGCYRNSSGCISCCSGDNFASSSSQYYLKNRKINSDKTAWTKMSILGLRVCGPWPSPAFNNSELQSLLFLSPL